MSEPVDNVLTPEEDEVVQTLASAWNKFLALPKLRFLDSHEFTHAIHEAQNIVLARPYLRSRADAVDGEGDTNV